MEDFVRLMGLLVFAVYHAHLQTFYIQRVRPQGL